MFSVDTTETPEDKKLQICIFGCLFSGMLSMFISVMPSPARNVRAATATTYAHKEKNPSINSMAFTVLSLRHHIVYSLEEKKKKYTTRSEHKAKHGFMRNTV